MRRTPYLSRHDMRYWTPQRLAVRRHGLTPPPARPTLAQVAARLMTDLAQFFGLLLDAMVQAAADVMAALSGWRLPGPPLPGPPWRYDATLVRRAVVSRGGW